jgi:crossover junction endodeoxyribonuclease RuvC
MIPSDKIILGIDPGTNIMGYGVIQTRGKDPVLRDMGILDMRKEKDPYKSLQIIFRQTIALIDQYCPDELAIEAPFYGKNVQSMLKLGRAQGVAIAAA